MDVRLIGEGGVEWTFSLPLNEVFADQVKARTLRPADEESAAAIADLLATDAADGSAPEPGVEEAKEPKELTLAERIDAATSHAQVNELGSELGVTFEEKKPALTAKKRTLHEAAAAKAADAADGSAPE